MPGFASTSRPGARGAREPADWQVGDLIVWDNRCTMHRREGFAGHGRRRMHRLMTLGERPV